MVSILPIFLHIPRTGGTSIRLMAEQELGKDTILTLYGADITNPKAILNRLSPEQVDQLGLIRGHISYGCHQWVPYPYRVCTYFTVVREPIDRILSLYRYILRDRGHHLHEDVSQMDIGEFVSSGITSEVNNGQVRQLCGTEGEFPQEPYASMATPFGKCRKGMLARTLDNINSHFCWTGTTDQLNAQIPALCFGLGWEIVPLGHVNRTKRDGGKQRLSKPDYDMIRSLNSLDIQLYQEVRGQV